MAVAESASCCRPVAAGPDQIRDPAPRSRSGQRPSGAQTGPTAAAPFDEALVPAIPTETAQRDAIDDSPKAKTRRHPTDRHRTSSLRLRQRQLRSPPNRNRRPRRPSAPGPLSKNGCRRTQSFKPSSGSGSPEPSSAAVTLLVRALQFNRIITGRTAGSAPSRIAGGLRATLPPDAHPPRSTIADRRCRHLAAHLGLVWVHGRLVAQANDRPIYPRAADARRRPRSWLTSDGATIARMAGGSRSMRVLVVAPRALDSQLPARGPRAMLRCRCDPRIPRTTGRILRCSAGGGRLDGQRQATALVGQRIRPRRLAQTADRSHPRAKLCPSADQVELKECCGSSVQPCWPFQSDSSPHRNRRDAERTADLVHDRTPGHRPAGQPVASGQAKISGAVRYGKRFKRLATIHDGKGTFTLETARVLSLTVELESPGQMTFRQEFRSPDKEPSLVVAPQYKFRLTPGIKIGGQVVDQAGRPVVGARVSAECPEDKPIDVGINVFDRTTRTSADGRWELSARRLTSKDSGFACGTRPTQTKIWPSPSRPNSMPT